MSARKGLLLIALTVGCAAHRAASVKQPDSLTVQSRAGSPLTQVSPDDRSAFARGVRFYQAHQLPEAVQAFSQSMGLNQRMDESTAYLNQIRDDILAQSKSR